MDKKQKIAISVAIVAVVLVVLIIFFMSPKTEYTVSFNSVGGQVVTSQEIEDGKYAQKPADPTREGYKFLGWYLGDELFDFSKPITGDITLTAKWEAVQGEQPVSKIYTITLKNGETTTTLTTNSEGILTEPEIPVKKGYKFLGWYIGDEKVDFSKPFNADGIIEAKWEKETVVENQTATNKPSTNKPTTKPTEPEKPVEPEKPTEPDTPVVPENPTEPDTPVVPEDPTEPDTPVVPETPKYTVAFKYNGEVIDTETVEESNKLSVVPLAPNRPGYTFKGWYSDGKEITENTVVNKDMTAEAQWDVYTFSVQLINGDAYSPNRKVVTYKNGKEIASTIIYGEYAGKAEYTLGKWNEKLGSVKVVSSEQLNAASNYKVQLNDGTKVFANRI